MSILFVYFRYHRTYNKKSKRHSVFPAKVQKTYGHIRTLMLRIIRRKILDRVGTHHRIIWNEDDLRRITRTLAPEDPPPTADIVQSKETRF